MTCFKNTMKNEMMYAWNVIQKHPTGLGVRNGWGVHKIRLVTS